MIYFNLIFDLIFYYRIVSRGQALQERRNIVILKHGRFKRMQIVQGRRSLNPCFRPGTNLIKRFCVFIPWTCIINNYFLRSEKKQIPFLRLCLCWNWFNFRHVHFLGNGRIISYLISYPFLKLKSLQMVL